LVDGFQARGAEAVELHTGDGVGQPAGDGSGARDVGALIPHRRYDTEDDVDDQRGAQIGVPRLELVEQAYHQVDRLGSVEGPAFVLATRRADRLVDERLCTHA